jgi:hypothetical protein
MNLWDALYKVYLPTPSHTTGDKDQEDKDHVSLVTSFLTQAGWKNAEINGDKNETKQKPDSLLKVLWQSRVCAHHNMKM